MWGTVLIHGIRRKGKSPQRTWERTGVCLNIAARQQRLPATGPFWSNPFQERFPINAKAKSATKFDENAVAN